MTPRTRCQGRRGNGVLAATLKIALPSVAMSIPVEYVKVRSRPSRHGLYWTTAVLRTRWERVAQSVEHVTFNHGVEGSSPSALTNDLAGPFPVCAAVLPAVGCAGRPSPENRQVKSSTPGKDAGVHRAARFAEVAFGIP